MTRLRSYLARERVLLLLVSLALLARAAWAAVSDRVDPFLIGNPYHGDAGSYERIARNLLAGIGYSEWPPAPDLFWPPLYPVLLAGMHQLVGDGPVGVRLVHALIGAATVGVFYLLARRLAAPAVAALATLFMALHPFLIYWGNWVTAEAPFMLLQCFMLLVLASARFDVRRAVGFGATAGVALLTKPAFLFTFPFMLGLLVARDRLGPGVRNALVAGAVAVLVVAPWTTRNYAVFGELVPISVNGGFTFYGANNPDAFGGHDERFPPPVPGLSRARQDREYYRLAMEWIRENPEAWIRLGAIKVARLYSPLAVSSSPDPMPVPYAPLVYVAYWGFLAVAVVGAFGMRDRLVLWPPILGATLAAIVFYGDTRYSVPMVPSLSLFAAYGCVYLAGAAGLLRRHLRPVVRGTVPLVLAALVVRGSPAQAQAPGYDSMDGCQGGWQRQYGVDVLVLDCRPGFATAHDRAFMFARRPVDVGADWRSQVDMETGAWLFDVGAQGRASLIVDFQRRGGALVAEIFDDTNDDGALAYGFERGYPRSVESRFPTLRVTADDGWWTRDGITNYNLRLEVDGRVYGAFSSDVYFEVLRNDGVPDIVIDVHDPGNRGRPQWQITQAKPGPPVSDSWGILRTTFVKNEAHDEVPVRTYIFWPYLGYMGEESPAPEGVRTPLWALPRAHYGMVKDFGVSYPPVQIDWQRSKIHTIGEFVASRSGGHNWFVYSLLRFGENGVTRANFENPFAFYDLANARDGYPDLQVRDQFFPAGDYHLDPPAVGPFHQIRYSWDQTHSHKWKYKLDLQGRRPMPATVDLGDGIQIQTVPYDEYPNWVTQNSWDFVDFIAVEGGVDARSSEGIYDQVCDCPADYFFGATTQPPTIDYAYMEIGRRGEYRLHLGEPPRLYGSAVDGKLHLYRAEAGLWKVDELEEVRYAAIGADFINRWDRLSGGTHLETLLHLGDRIVHVDASGVSIARGPAAPDRFIGKPPATSAELRNLTEQLASLPKVNAGSDLRAIWEQFGEERSFLPGAAMWDARPTAAGFESTIRLTEPADAAWAAEYGPGTYRLTYTRDGGFALRVARPLSLMVGSPKVRGDPPVEYMPTRLSALIKNDGDEDAVAVPVAFHVGRAGQSSQVVSWTTVDVPAGGAAVAEVSWNPPSAGDWRVAASALKEFATAAEPVDVKVGTAPLTDVGSILLAQGLRPFAGGAISASLTLAVAIAIGLGTVLWLPPRRRG